MFISINKIEFLHYLKFSYEFSILEYFYFIEIINIMNKHFIITKLKLFRVYQGWNQ